jgi:hypothetical protein
MVEIIPCILSKHTGIKLEINGNRSYRKFLNTWRVNNSDLNNQWVIEEIREEMKKFQMKI